jgi:putative membrane protein insertion efficiency factor
MKFIFIILIKFYKFFLNPFILSSCRFNPNCSNYFLFVLNKYSFFLAFLLIMKRVLKCMCFSGGYDPSP